MLWSKPGPWTRSRKKSARPSRESGGDGGGAAGRRAVNRSHSPLWRPAYVAVGGNVGQPRDRVIEAIARLDSVKATRLELRSRLYLTRPLGAQNQPYFVNAVAGLLTQLMPRDLLAELLAVERAMGRERQEHWGPRIIDLDLLWVSGEPISEPGLDLPHPGVSDRNFVLYPLFDVAPTLLIPGHGIVAGLKERVGADGIEELG